MLHYKPNERFIKLINIDKWGKMLRKSNLFFILSISIFVLLISSFVDASQIITLNDIKYFDVRGNSVDFIKYPGQKIIANITVTDDLGYLDIKGVYSTWSGLSKVYCIDKNKVSDYQKEFICIIQIESTMPTNLNIGLNSESFSGLGNIYFLGNYTLTKILNLTEQYRCITHYYCSSYIKIAIRQCLPHNPTHCSIKYVKTNDCLTYSPKRVCYNR